MGYGMHFPANQLGGPKKVWTIREYGLSQVWVKAETTVLLKGARDALRASILVAPEY
jgi:GMP synthase-like glutamine amidotransferase